MNNNGKVAESFPTPQSLHESINIVLRDGEPKDIAARLGRTARAIDQWGEDPEVSKHPIPANKIVPFCLAANDMRPLEWMAEQVRAVLIRIPEVPKSMSETGAEMANLAREFSDVLTAFTKALEDGKLTAKEEGSVKKELDELIRQAVRFRRMFS